MRRAVIRKPGPRACLKRRSGARLSLLQQTCRQGSGRRLQALGHCFRAAAPQAHFLLTFWGASQKVRRCKSAKRSTATSKSPDADARTNLPQYSLFLPASKMIPHPPTPNPQPHRNPPLPPFLPRSDGPGAKSGHSETGASSLSQAPKRSPTESASADMPSGQRKALTGSWPLFSRRRTKSALFAYFLGRQPKSKAL